MLVVLEDVWCTISEDCVYNDGAHGVFHCCHCIEVLVLHDFVRGGVLEIYVCYEADKNSTVTVVELCEMVQSFPGVFCGVDWCGL